MAGPRKRSVMIAGHATSVTLEPEFWAALEAGARARNLPLNALIAAIDAERVARSPSPDLAPNLASAIRCWILADLQSAIGTPSSVDNENHYQ